jgi:hypothetical protein
MLTKIAVFFETQPRNYFMISIQKSPGFLNLDLAALDLHNITMRFLSNTINLLFRILETNILIFIGRVTDIRTDLSNNGRLAYILVAYRLHTKILHNSPDLFGKISLYAGDEELFPKDSSARLELSKVKDYYS